MGLWKRIADVWKQTKARDEQDEREAAIDRYLKDRDHQYREQGREPRLPPRGDRG
jgi:hypothetical protein